MKCDIAIMIVFLPIPDKGLRKHPLHTLRGVFPFWILLEKPTSMKD